MHSLYRSRTRGPEDDSVESKHVIPLSHYMFNITTVVSDGPSPPFTIDIAEKYWREHIHKAFQTAILKCTVVFKDLRSINYKKLTRMCYSITIFDKLC